MFERFTDRARRVVVLAHEEARMLNHDSVGTGHILLALIRQGRGVAASVLASLGITPDAARSLVQEVIDDGPIPSTVRRPFTLSAKKVLEMSFREALRSEQHKEALLQLQDEPVQRRQARIETKHVLLALIEEPGGVGARVLVRLGADSRHVRQEIEQEESVRSTWQASRGFLIHSATKMLREVVDAAAARDRLIEWRDAMIQIRRGTMADREALSKRLNLVVKEVLHRHQRRKAWD